MNRSNVGYIVLSLVLIGVGVALRLLPHPPNVAPIAALAFVSAVYLPKQVRFIVPLVSLFLGDLFLGFYTWQVMLSVYGSFALIALLGRFVLRQPTYSRFAGASLIGSCVFFLITNAAVWAFGRLYPFTIDGLLQSYMQGLPFFRFTLMGDMVYLLLFVSIAESIRAVARMPQVVGQRKMVLDVQ